VCLLSLLLPGAEVDRDEWRTAAIANPDGFGWAVHTGASVVRLRTMDYRTAVNTFTDARDHWPNGVAMFHWRWATGGRVDRTMAHPFRWGDDERIAIGHNGVLPIEPTATESDTALLARYLGGAGAHVLDDASWRADLGQFAAGSKLVFLSAHPDTAADWYIVNESAGHWRAGTWFSNTSYLPWTPAPRQPVTWAPTSTSTSRKDRRGWALDAWDDVHPDDIGCAVCGQWFTVAADSLAGYCPTCDACWLCDSDIDACRCHVERR